MNADAPSTLNWLPWDPTAFALAAATGRPILLVLGPFWAPATRALLQLCTAAPDITTLVSQWFVPILLDREARPDLDAHFQRAGLLLSGHTGWPLILFLTPDGDPFYGGVYGSPSLTGDAGELAATLSMVHRLYLNRAEDIFRGTLELRATLSLPVASDAGDGPEAWLRDPEIAVIQQDLLAFIEHLREAYDMRQGGFGSGPRFVNVPALALLLRHHDLHGDAWAFRLAEQSMELVARGALHDPLEGGFFRGASDPEWNTPEFEKLLRGNLELLRLYQAGEDVLGGRRCRAVVEGILSLLMGRLLEPGTGWFGASIAASSPGLTPVEQYTWTREQLEALFPPDPRSTLGGRDRGEFAGGTVRWVALKPGAERGTVRAGESARIRSLDDDDTQHLALTRLREARAARALPPVDFTPYACQQGLAIQAILDLPDPGGDVRRAAFDLLDRCLDALSLEGAVPRLLEGGGSGLLEGGGSGLLEGGGSGLLEGGGSGLLEGGGPGLLEDQAAVGLALLAGFAATGQGRYFRGAHRVVRHLLSVFWDVQAGLFRLRSPRLDIGLPALEGLLAEGLQDRPSCSPVSLALELLNGMAALQDDASLLFCRGRAVETAGRLWPLAGVLASGVMRQVQEYLEPGPLLLVVGRGGDARTLALREAGLRSARRGRRVVVLDPEEDVHPVSRQLDGLRERYRPVFGPNAYLIWGGACEPAPEEPGALAARLSTVGRIRS